MERDAEGELWFQTPGGRPLPEVPPAWTVSEDAVEELRALNEAVGLHLDANTTRPSWSGERLDVGWAIGVLHPRGLEPGVKREWMDDPLPDQR